VRIVRLIGPLLAAALLAACHSKRPVEKAPRPVPVLPQEEESPPVTEDIPPPSATLPETAEIPPCLPVDNSPPPPKHRPRPHVVAAPPEPLPAPAPANREASVKPIEMVQSSVLGKSVRGLDGEDLGRVVDVLADTQGHVRLAVIEYGGFLGVGIRRVAVDWSLLRFPAKDGSVELAVNRRALQATPEYKDSGKTLALMAPAAPPAAQPPPTPPPNSNPSGSAPAASAPDTKN
jgi:hypothetical protein